MYRIMALIPRAVPRLRSTRLNVPRRTLVEHRGSRLDFSELDFNETMTEEACSAIELIEVEIRSCKYVEDGLAVYVSDVAESAGIRAIIHPTEQPCTQFIPRYHCDTSNIIQDLKQDCDHKDILYLCAISNTDSVALFWKSCEYVGVLPFEMLTKFANKR